MLMTTHCFCVDCKETEKCVWEHRHRTSISAGNDQAWWTHVCASLWLLMHDLTCKSRVIPCPQAKEARAVTLRQEGERERARKKRQKQFTFPMFFYP